MPTGEGMGQGQGQAQARGCLIVGQANVGKTLFLVNFAEHLGARELDLEVTWPDSRRERFRYSVARARELLVDSRPHTTRALQTVVLELPRGKGRKAFRLSDTGGLTDTVHGTLEVRLGQAQSLRALRYADLVLHMMDAAAAGTLGVREAIGEVDRQVARFAPLRGAYAILANKMDLPWAQAGLLKIAREFPRHRVIPVSALDGRGFREVKSFVWDRL